MAEGSLPDSLEFSSDSSLHQTHNQRFRRGRARPDPNRNLTAPDYDPSQQYRRFQQSVKPHFVHGSSTYPARFHPPYHQEDMARGRGRGKIGGGFGRGSGFRHQPAMWQRPTEDVSPSGGNQGFGGIYNPTSPMEQADTDGLSWRRETGRKPGGPGHEEHMDTRPKKSGKFTQDPRRRNRDEKGIRGDPMLDKQENQENNAVEAGRGTAKSRDESHSSDMKVRNQRGQRDSNWNPYPRFDSPKTLLEPNRRKGPIKPPKPQEQGSSEKNSNFQDFPVQEFPVSVKQNRNPTKEEPSWRAERGQGRRTPLQDRGQRRAHHFEPRAGQKKWDNVPKSKETQTGCLIEQLTEEKYECMVCCDVVRVMAPVWSCQSCFHVFHLNCIKKWARSPASQGDDSAEGWRCPACQNIVLKPPNSYTCFCGKVTNPEWQRTEIPHSCGDMCGKKRSGVDCNHPCNILCHPGPCPQCPAFIQKSCICGITSQPMRCGQAAVVHCNTMCGAMLNCAEHTCTQVCHSGQCQPCQIQVKQDCYCGATCREVLCGLDKDGFDGSGHFSCEDPCGKMLDCEAHTCQQVCHPGPCKPCPRSPKLVKTCPCGQTPLTKLLELGYSERSVCSDPIPSCGKTCNQPLVCGSDDTIHLCEKLCHEGTCGPCALTSTIRCGCGSKTKEVPCATIHNEDELIFACDKRCNKKRQCGRHKCGEPCCVRVEHKCPLICGYKLNCGLHRCQEPCHRGNCQPCWQASFDELTCHCGLTVLYPPIACGTKPPECKNLCSRRHECDHPVFHNCHSEEKCPPCTYLTQKWCMGNHEQRSNIACHLQDISCGLVCNKLLDCEMHHCKRICHRAECLGEDVCQQPCVLPRPDCGHPCGTRCHKGTGCPRNACTAKVALQCDCGRRKETVACLEAANTYQRYAAIAMASKLSDMQLGDSVDIAQLITKKEIKQTRLECDQDCATLERNRRLAEALQIDSAVDPFNTRSTSKYSDSLKDDARKDLKFVSEVEEKIKNMVELANKGKQPKRSYCFPPMNREHRKIVHELAEVYAVESVSYDSEPKRNVVITAHRGKSSCPGSSLTSLIERETATRAPPPIAHIKQHSSKADSGSSWSKMVKEEPVIDYFDVQD